MSDTPIKETKNWFCPKSDCGRKTTTSARKVMVICPCGTKMEEVLEVDEAKEAKEG